ncbi:DUF995 domain-containing protein [Labrys monachus]|uniref:Uncharacterized protein n=1 Tax=Labrys monachus TaxID=217067 RepID=A0ABU0FIW3_9HYPH|nr:hypothetical protein [Labrys monachus]MDQ0394556.1 hypothetical protein [Labrys monachus]
MIGMKAIFMRVLNSAAVLILALVLPGNARAGTDSSFSSDIPELTREEVFDNVRALTQEETFDIYAGNTISYPNAVLYFKSNGDVLGYSKDGRGYAFGTWKVKDYKFCMKNIWHYSGALKTEAHWTCNEWYSDGAAYWTKVTKSTVDGFVDQVIKGDVNLVSLGDHASPVVNKMAIEARGLAQ